MFATITDFVQAADHFFEEFSSDLVCIQANLNPIVPSAVECEAEMAWSHDFNSRANIKVGVASSGALWEAHQHVQVSSDGCASGELSVQAADRDEKLRLSATFDVVVNTIASPSEDSMSAGLHVDRDSVYAGATFRRSATGETEIKAEAGYRVFNALLGVDVVRKATFAACPAVGIAFQSQDVAFGGRMICDEEPSASLVIQKTTTDSIAVAQMDFSQVATCRIGFAQRLDFYGFDVRAAVMLSDGLFTGVTSVPVRDATLDLGFGIEKAAWPSPRFFLKLRL